MPRGLTIGRGNDVQESISKMSTSLELLASGDGIEISRQRIAAGKHFYLRAVDEWAGFELMYVLAGVLVLEDPDMGEVRLHVEEFIHHNGLSERAYFRAETDVELLMVSSSPSFHLGQSEIQDMVSLARSVEEKDETTDGHCLRLERLAILTGEQLGLAGQQLIDLSFGAYLHDIGKVKVSDDILIKTEALTQEEWAEMRKHPEYGAELLREKEILKGAAGIVRAHHERWDGGGYPDGLEEDAIPIGARIIAVVDTYDAIISARPYKKALAKEDALAELEKHAGSQFDPRVVRAFLQVVGSVGDEDRSECAE